MTLEKKNIISRIRKKRTAFFGIIFIIIIGLLSLFANLIIPDNSPNANDQHLEMALKEPMFKSSYIRTKSVLKKNDQSFLNGMVYGFEKSYDLQMFQQIDLDKKPIELISQSGQLLFVNKEDLFIERGATSIKVMERTFYLGTDKFGRDVLSRLILGVRISLLVGFIAVILSVLIGVLLGAIGGYFGGFIDDIIMLLINTSWSIPTLLLVFAIVLALGRGITIIFFAVGVTMWVEVARIVRGQVLNIKEELFVQAAKSMAFSWRRILFKHILPNTIGAILVVASANFAMAILIEAGLSYLGFGIRPPMPSIGTMLNENYGYALSGKTYLAVAPALTIMLMVLAFNLIGSGLRDVLDVKRED